MARTIPHRELRNNSSAVLREVKAGGTVEVTNHGEVVAVLVPPPGPSGLESLRVKKATGNGRFTEIKGVEIDRPSQEILDELRGEK